MRCANFNNILSDCLKCNVKDCNANENKIKYFNPQMLLNVNNLFRGSKLIINDFNQTWEPESTGVCR
jgi:hypothetical protein